MSISRKAALYRMELKWRWQESKRRGVDWFAVDPPDERTLLAWASTVTDEEWLRSRQVGQVTLGAIRALAPYVEESHDACGRVEIARGVFLHRLFDEADVAEARSDIAVGQLWVRLR